jgi:hypothetical protein
VCHVAQFNGGSCITREIQIGRGSAKGTDEDGDPGVRGMGVRRFYIQKLAWLTVDTTTSGFGIGGGGRLWSSEVIGFRETGRRCIAHR